MKTEWVQKKLGELGSVNPNNREPIPDHFIYIDLESVVSGQLLAEKLISKKEAPSRAQRIVYFNDVLYQTVRPYQNNNYIHKKRGDYIASTGYALIRCYEDYDPDFVYYLLHTQHFESVVLGLCTGTSYPAIAPNSLKRIEVAVPSTLPAQRRIAAILSSADKVIASTQKVIAKYKQMKQGMMEDLLKPKEGWKMVKLGEVCERITDGSHESPKAEESGYYMPSVKDMRYDSFDFSNCKRISKTDFLRLKDMGCKPDKGDVLIAKDGSILKYCFVMKEDLPIVILSSIAILKPDKNTIDGQYLAYYFQKQDVVTDVVENYKSGTGVPRIVLRNFSEIEISFPVSISEQRRIAAILLGIDAKIAAEEKVLEKYGKIKKGLMERLLEEIV